MGPSCAPTASAARPADASTRWRWRCWPTRGVDERGVDVSGFPGTSCDAFADVGALPIDLVVTLCDSAAAESCPVFLGGQGQAPLKVHWGYPDPSREAGETAQRRAFELARQALVWRLRQLLDALDALGGNAPAAPDRAALQHALVAIGRS